jgi:hypothetical protein
MSRAWVVYILMFVVLIGGLWFIIEIGGAMRAPDDLSGEWNVAWLTAPPPDAAAAAPMRIDQSGRFFEVRWGDKARPLSMILRPGWRGNRDGRRLLMELAGGAWTMRVDGDIPLKSLRTPAVNIELIGPTSRHLGLAELRGYERPAPATRATAAAGGVAGAR